MKSKCPDDEEIGKTKEVIEKFNIKSGDELIEFF